MSKAKLFCILTKLALCCCYSEYIGLFLTLVLFSYLSLLFSKPAKCETVNTVWAISASTSVAITLSDKYQASWFLITGNSWSLISVTVLATAPSSLSLAQSRLSHLHKHRPVVKALSMPSHVNLSISQNVLVCSPRRQNNYGSFVSSWNYNCALINTFCSWDRCTSLQNTKF